MFMQRKLQKFFSFLDYIKRTIHFIFYCRFYPNFISLRNNGKQPYDFSSTIAIYYWKNISKGFKRGLRQRTPVVSLHSH